VPCRKLSKKAGKRSSQIGDWKKEQPASFKPRKAEFAEAATEEGQHFARNKNMARKKCQKEGGPGKRRLVGRRKEIQIVCRTREVFNTGEGASRLPDAREEKKNSRGDTQRKVTMVFKTENGKRA